MSLLIFRRFALIVPLMLLASCGSSTESGTGDAAGAPRIDCAMGGAKAFERSCTLARMTSAEGIVLVVGRADAGYRRLLVTTDGRGLVAADGVEPASVTIIGDGLIEVAIGGDRFRLPADTDGVP